MSTFRQDLEAAREDVNDLIFTSDAGKFVEAHNKLTRFLSRPDLVSIEEVEG